MKWNPFKKNTEKTVNKSELLTGSILVGDHFVRPADWLKITGSANWIDTNNLYAIFMNNPILYAALSINAKYFSSVDVRVRNIKTGEIYSKQSMREGKITDPVAKKMFELLSMPNPLQSTVEFLILNSITYDLYGNSFIRGNFAFNRVDIQTVATLHNLWPQFVKPKMTGKYLNALKLSDIVEKWEYTLNNKDYITEFTPDEILHRKEPNLDYSVPEDVILGKSRVISLQKPLSNITLAYETRNVIAKERGMRVIISADNKDVQLGNIPLTSAEEKKLQDAFKLKYGTLEGQNQFHFSPFAIKVDQIDQDIRKLGILEEIGMDALAVANTFNIPIELLKMYLQGATYENQGASDRRMYQTNAIPRANDFFEDINNWLNVRKYGFEYVPNWDHIAVLQEDKKEASLVRRNETFVCRDTFLIGGLTINEVRERLGWEKTNNPVDNLRIYEMTPEQVTLVTGRNTMVAQNENRPAADSSSQI